LKNSTGTPVDAALPVWNAPLRALHCGLLLVGGTEMAREFWGGHPLELHDQILSDALLHQHIWDEQGLSPLEYQLRVIESVETFCLQRGIDFIPFLEKYVFGLHSGTFLSPKGTLSLVGKFLIQLTRSRDVRRTVLELLEPSNRMISPRTVARLARVDQSDGRFVAWVLQVQDLSFQGRLPGYDADSWLGMQLRHSPNRMGVASFDEVDCLCQVRGTQEILESIPRGSRSQDAAFRGGAAEMPRIRKIGFFEWCREQGVSPEDVHEVPDHEVELVEQDVFCPVRRRRVIQSGSILNAKCYLMRVRWGGIPSIPVESGLARLIRDVMGEDGPSEMDRASALHEQLMQQFRQRLQFVYHKQDETISCNGEHLLRGVPAKILHKVLMSHTVTGRTVFEHREFRRDPDLHLDPVNPNLESRIRILSERLEERLQGIRILKSGRGRFELETAQVIEFSEE
jgi:hypothetical protein